MRGGKRRTSGGDRPGIGIQRALQYAVRRIGIDVQGGRELPLAGVEFDELTQEVDACGPGESRKQRRAARPALRAQVERAGTQLPARHEGARARALRRRLERGRAASLAHGCQGLDLADPDPQHVFAAGFEAPELAGERVDAQQAVGATALRNVKSEKLQLAAALVWCQGDPLHHGFVCLDQRLREAARREGFTVFPNKM